MNQVFTGEYGEYFNESLDQEAVNYLMLANFLVHSINPRALTIIEEVSGYPSLCRGILDGGVGFDYRLSMGIPALWDRLLLEQRDEEWNLEMICHSLQNRRLDEKFIALVENHNQAIKGRQTLATKLFR